MKTEQIEKLREVIEEMGVERSLTYSLADAIREGSMTTEQCIGSWEGDNGTLCALSAALLAVKAHKLV